MIEFYPQIKFVHVWCVILSGSLFALRGILMMADSRWANHVILRGLSYAIDTTLLTAALMLATVLHQYPIMHDWLTVKVALLVVYIVLGVYALRRGHSKRTRVICYFAALAVLLTIVSVARAHHPLGWLASLAR